MSTLTNKQTNNITKTTTVSEAGSTATETDVNVNLMEEDSLMSSGPNKNNAEVTMNASTDVDNMDLDQVSQKRRRMTNGQKKRLQKMIADGKTFAEAIETIREQEKSIGGAKRQRSDDSIPDNPPKRKADMSYRDAVTGIKVAIAAVNFPEEELSLEQLNKVDDAIMNAVEKIPIEGTRVSFSYCSFKPGYMVLTCVNEESKKWITSVVPTLKPWEGAKLRCMDGNDLPKPFIHLVWIPGQVEITPKSILDRMMRQNEGMCTTNWVVVNDLKCDKGHTMTVSVDSKSEKYLKERNYSVYLRFGKVTFRPKNKPNVFKTTETAEVSTVAKPVIKPSVLSKAPTEEQASTARKKSERPTLERKQRVDLSGNFPSPTSAQAGSTRDRRYSPRNGAQRDRSKPGSDPKL